ncbi:hypothetical protein LWM68_06410 [Niabella sp. W65]|nr:hypothetical protein [Niabella sp. W65]MCH7362429.1 hypothetical protein [Niabella sp. W65]
MENSNIFNDNGLLDQYGKINLEEAGKWSRFLAIVGFVILGIMLVFGLFAGSLMMRLNGCLRDSFCCFWKCIFYDLHFGSLRHSFLSHLYAL